MIPDPESVAAPRGANGAGQPTHPRGEFAVVLGGETFVLRPTFKALAEMEQRAGCGLLALANRFHQQVFTLRDMLAVLGPGIAAGGRTPPDNLGELVVAANVIDVAAACARFLVLALTGGRPAAPAVDGAAADPDRPTRGAASAS